MKYLVPLCLALLFAFTAANTAYAQEPKPREILTNESIVSLTKAGFKERTIITLIRTSETAFDISTLKLVELKKRSVSERIITEMIEITNRRDLAQRLTTLRDDEFFAKDDEAFFNGSPVFKELPTEKEARKKEEEAMIFGSQSGGKSKARSRGFGPNGDREDSSEVMGSASVRIVRPSGETSGATPKLERAPKLDNGGVLEMVQAGFSEGTIIRKIESSQVEFDLSPKAVEDLKKNRVSERVLSAMKTAMDESK
ncbi:MAG: hypothetical protein JST85_14545 [Acidobacteria bacterium]|nr:hypothetical protein [Acidobacteriota bacterium]